MASPNLASSERPTGQEELSFQPSATITLADIHQQATLQDVIPLLLHHLQPHARKALRQTSTGARDGHDRACTALVLRPWAMESASACARSLELALLRGTLRPATVAIVQAGPSSTCPELDEAGLLALLKAACSPATTRIVIKGAVALRSYTAGIVIAEAAPRATQLQLELCSMPTATAVQQRQPAGSGPPTAGCAVLLEALSPRLTYLRLSLPWAAQSAADQLSCDANAVLASIARCHCLRHLHLELPAGCVRPSFLERVLLPLVQLLSLELLSCSPGSTGRTGDGLSGLPELDSSGVARPADLAALAALTGLTRLAVHLGRPMACDPHGNMQAGHLGQPIAVPAAASASVAANAGGTVLACHLETLLSSVTRLRSLDLGLAELDESCMSALHRRGAQLTYLAAGGLQLSSPLPWWPAALAADTAAHASATHAGGLPPGTQPSLPAELVELRLRSPLLLPALARLVSNSPQTHSALARILVGGAAAAVDAATPDGIHIAGTWGAENAAAAAAAATGSSVRPVVELALLPAGAPPVCLPPTASLDAAAAFELLQGRIPVDEWGNTCLAISARQPDLLSRHVWRPVLPPVDAVAVSGPHAPWLRALAGLACRSLTLRELWLGRSDLEALAGVAVHLQELTLQRCGLFAHSLLELCDLPRLQRLSLECCDPLLSTEGGVAVLQELACRNTSLVRVRLLGAGAQQGGGDDGGPGVGPEGAFWGGLGPGGFDPAAAAREAMASLALQGRGGVRFEVA